MAVYEYFYDCPQCDKSESVRVTAHIRRDVVSAQEPIQSCQCSLTRGEEEALMDQALEEAMEDAWAAGDYDDCDTPYDRFRDAWDDDE